MANKKQFFILIGLLILLGTALAFWGLSDFGTERNIIQYQSDADQNDIEPENTLPEEPKQDPNSKQNRIADYLSTARVRPKEQNMEKSISEQLATEIKIDEDIPIPTKSNPKDASTKTKVIEEEIVTEPKTVVSDNTVNILFLGIDRTAFREERNISFGADTILLTRIDLDHRKIKALSIPRDTYTYIPVNEKMDKVSYSYSYGFLEGKAVKSTMDTLSHLIDGRQIIDYYFTLDMEPVPEIIDELGGVELDVEIDMQSHGVNLSKGKQRLDGKSAFDYIHWRYAKDGDIGRIKRQQEFILAMLEKLKTLNSKEELLDIILSNEQYIDSDMGIEQLANLIQLLSEMKEEDIEFFILPGNPDNINNISYWMVDEEACKDSLHDFIAN